MTDADKRVLFHRARPLKRTQNTVCGHWTVISPEHEQYMAINDSLLINQLALASARAAIIISISAQRNFI